MEIIAINHVYTQLIKSQEYSVQFQSCGMLHKEQCEKPALGSSGPENQPNTFLGVKIVNKASEIKTCRGAEGRTKELCNSWLDRE